jgi:hypothetical protein
MKRKVAVGVAVVLLLAGGAAAWRLRWLAPEPVAAHAPKQPYLLTSGVPEAFEVYAALLVSAQQLPEPVMSGGQGRVPGQAQVAAVAMLEDKPQQLAPTGVGAEREVLIGFTGNVVAETDPCG